MLDLLPFMKELWRLLERTLPETIRVDLVYEQGEYFISADLTRLQQAIMNLALNARDAMPNGGALRIALKSITLDKHETPTLPDMAPGEWIIIEVSDSGNGIRREDLPHIFEPFFTTKPPGEGTGLGLAQVYGIVKQHDGYIDVTSQTGKGSSFIIYLPPLPAHIDSAPAAREEHIIEGQGEMILLVEDDAATRQAVEEVLQMLKYRVLTAANGEQAIALFRQHADEIALVLSDLVMPNLGGAALHARLSEQKPDVKMVVMTGYPLQTEDKTLLNQGIIAWVQKPFEAEEIASALRKALSA